MLRIVQAQTLIFEKSRKNSVKNFFQLMAFF